MNRRTLLGALALAPLARPALAQSGWPDRSLRIVVPFAPGSFTDISARLVANEMSGPLGQQVIVENRGGAGGTLGATAVVRSAPDGYTMLLTDNSLAISPGLYPNLPFDPLKDLQQVSQIATSPSILLVRPGLGPKTLAELVALAKQKPGEISFGSGGQGSSAHLAMELLLNVAGIRALHVPFRGVAAAIQEVISGRVDMAIASLASGVAHVRSGALLGIAVSGDARNATLPDVPTFAQAGQPGYTMSYWWGIAVPSATPAPVVARLNREVVAACEKPALREAFARSAAVPVTSTPEAMTAFLTRDVALWKEVITRAGVRVE
ncbi:tripartite tricarboxylate transporter substrate-binding protein [Roseomonas sp. AR75]|uniref:tripartite tricarboxylate transporter substrate-binding protein n=1 Tax=Roseomonas sp. AR75 TaxID=2562311 RepID=UPI0010C1508C|nr:tripartite tricarboxylate transporter substrate-binding protein [Roseomonas sp. AR75]